MNKIKLSTGSKIGILVKRDCQKAEDLSKEILKWYEDRGFVAWRLHTTTDFIFPELLEGTGLLLVLGGDGTIVSVARQSLGSNIPLVGINFGRVGFLAELNEDNWQDACGRILKDGLKADQRMSLHLQVERNGQLIFEGEAINDIVITRGECARLVKLELSLDDESLMELRSDGLIISTPTGSSGYACSAGGALISPCLDVYLITAICPFLNAFHPLVLNGDANLKIQVQDANTKLYATIDGQENLALELGDIVKIKGLKNRFRFVDTGCENYVERLRRVGFTRSFGEP